MREIKFRAWDKKTKRMRKVNSIVLDELTEEIKLVNLWGRDIIENKDIIIQRENGYILMQFTGLKDNKGKEIYEGDILVAHDEYFGDMYSYVDFENCSFIVKEKGCKDTMTLSDLMCLDPKVVGNMYYNPELINE